MKEGSGANPGKGGSKNSIPSFTAVKGVANVSVEAMRRDIEATIARLKQPATSEIVVVGETDQEAAEKRAAAGENAAGEVPSHISTMPDQLLGGKVSVEVPQPGSIADVGDLFQAGEAPPPLADADFEDRTQIDISRPSSVPCAPGMDEASTLQQLAQHFTTEEWGLIHAALGPEEISLGHDNTIDYLKAFLELHPAVRDLRMRLHVTNQWTEGDWRTDIATYNRALQNLRMLFEFPELSPAEMAKGLTMEAENPNSQVSSRIVDAIRDAARQTMSSGKQHSPDSPFERLITNYKTHASPAFALGNLVHKLRIADKFSCYPAETSIMQAVIGHQTLSGDDYRQWRRAFVIKGQGEGKDFNYYPEVIKSFCLYRKSLGIRSLLEAARAEAQIRTIAEFCGMPQTDVVAVIDRHYGVTIDKKRTSIHYAEDFVPVEKQLHDETKLILREGSKGRPNQDAICSFTIRLPEGREMILDAVFDGAGGHDDGDLASHLAREVVELFATVGWIRGPEDARRALVTADLMITFESISKKKHLPQKTEDVGKSDNYLSREHEMTTTAVVALVLEGKFYGIHCGDCGYDVIRKMDDGAKQGSFASVCFSIPHIYESLFTLSRLQSESIRVSTRREFEAEARKTAVAPTFRFNLNSALGLDSSELQINGSNKAFEGFELKPEDLLLMYSDGLSKTMHHLEVALLCEGLEPWDVSSRDEIAKTALGRNQKGSYRFGPNPEDELTVRGPDDISFIIRKFYA